MLNKVKSIKAKSKFSGAEKRLQTIFRTLGDPGRFKIFKLLLNHHEICVGEIARILGVSMPAVSQQLRILETSGLICKERMGQMICYKVSSKDYFVQALKNCLSKYTKIKF